MVKLPNVKRNTARENSKTVAAATHQSSRTCINKQDKQKSICWARRTCQEGQRPIQSSNLPINNNTTAKHYHKAPSLSLPQKVQIPKHPVQSHSSAPWRSKQRGVVTAELNTNESKLGSADDITTAIYTTRTNKQTNQGGGGLQYKRGGLKL